MSLALLQAIVSFVGFVPSVFSQGEESSQQGGELFIDSDTTWSGEMDMGNYDAIYIDNGATLKIEPGTSIKIRSLYLYDGKIEAIGSSEKKITIAGAPFVSLSEDGYDKYCSSRSAGTIYFQGYGDEETDPESVFEYVEFVDMGEDFSYDSDNCPGLSFLEKKSGFFNVAYAAQEYKRHPALEFNSGKVSVLHSSFLNNAYADIVVDFEMGDDWNRQSYLHISDSNFNGTSEKKAILSSVLNYADVQDCTGACGYRDSVCRNACYEQAITHHPDKVLLDNNWYGSADGPTVDNEKKGIVLSGDYTLRNWSTKEHELFSQGSSNVMFLPGIKASKLYKKGMVGTEDQLWPPNYFGNDLGELNLDGNGKSIESVYTRDAISEVGIPMIKENIYKSFLEKLAELKEEGTITDYSEFAYDWRQSVEDIVERGTPYQNETKSAIETLKNLSESSKSKKVTIVAHSNGGLLAKAIMLELENLNLTDKVDKIILVGTPQMGTPLATLSMLYGYDESAIFGTLISRKDSRILAENMPGAYGLLPSFEYFRRLENPFITFSSERTGYFDFKKSYGDSIDDYGEFKSFLLGEGDGRNKPAINELEKENILNGNLLNEASEMHQKLDAWIPPQNVEVIQIAGWGLDTVSGVEYKEKEQVSCAGAGSVPYCFPNGKFEPIYEPKFTVDGDKVVVSPSALMLSEAPNVKRYWVDLWTYNAKFKDRKHKDLLEIEELINNIFNIFQNKVIDTTQFFRYSRPDPKDYLNPKPRLRLSLYSPLDIHLYDKYGNHTGPKEIEIDGVKQIVIEEAIPSSYYIQYGERKYVGFSGGENINIEMDGYANGSYTLKMEEVKISESAEEIVSHTEFKDLPVSPQTKIKLEIPESGLAEVSSLTADFDGDGTEDYSVVPVPNGTTTLADNQAPKISIINPKEKSYLNSGTLKIEYAVSDNFSKPEDVVVEIYVDGNKVESETLMLPYLKTGKHEIILKTSDEAGNESQEEVNFEIMTDLQSIYSNLKIYTKDGLMDKNVAKHSSKTISSLIRLEKIIDMIRKSRNIKEKDKKKLEVLAKHVFEKSLDNLVIWISRMPQKKISSEGREILINNLRNIQTSF